MFKILLAIAGITGIGKSYYKDKITDELKFNKIKILTTRKKRIGEKENDDKIFVTEKELLELEAKGEIAYKFNMLGIWYAYTKKELFSKENTVFELHYETIYDLKKICPNMKSIYLMPNDINIAKQMLKNRKLDKTVEEKRIAEIEEHYNKITTDKDLIKMFDYVIYNNYDEKTDKQVLDLVKKIME